MRLALFASFCIAPLSLAQVWPPFDAAVVVGDASQQIVKTLDLNGDGWMDAFGWWTDATSSDLTGSGHLHGWINDGSGRLDVAWTIPYSDHFNDFLPIDVSAVGDLDGDGDDDFVTATQSIVRVYLSNGASAPTLRISQAGPDGAWIRSVALADLDADPEPELVLSAGVILAILDIDLANATLVERTRTQTQLLPSGKLVVAELTGDAELDILLGGTLIHPVAGGLLQPATHSFPLPWSPVSWDMRFDGGDIDEDGDFDLVAFAVRHTGASPEFRIVRRSGRSTWVVEPPSAGGPARMLVDVDGDGDLDGVCCGGGGGGSPDDVVNSKLSNFRIALNDGTGSFAASISMPSVGSKAIAGAADLDLDGDVDLIGGRCVLYAQGPITTHPSPAFSVECQHPSTVFDFDGDADPDFEPQGTNIRSNRGDGTVELLSMPFPPPAIGLTRNGDPFVGDWDGDGDPDFMFLLQGSLGNQGLELVRNHGGRSFASGVVVAGDAGLSGLSSGAHNALAADLDGDGDLDLVLRSRTALWKSAWWENQGVSFVLREEWLGVCVVHAADVDGDRVLDLVATAGGDAAVPLRWTPGLGFGAFGSWVTVADTSASSHRDDIALADLDGDGDLDIAAGHFALKRVYIHWNDGLGTFTREATPLLDTGSTSSLPHTVVADDVDGDGLLDLLAAPVRNATNALAVFLRSPDNSGWRSPIQQVAFFADLYGLPRGFSLGDVDGDGDLDLLTNHLARGLRFVGEEAGTRVQDTSGSTGLGGVKPLFGASGPFRVGESAELRVRGLRPGSAGRVVVSFPSDPTPPSFGPMQAATPQRIHSVIPFTASGLDGDPAGSGAWSLNYTVPGYSAGRTKLYRAYVLDDMAQGGECASNRLYVTYGL